MVDALNNAMSYQVGRMSRLSKDISNLQTQISTGKKYVRPSDDPTASARIASLRRSDLTMEAWQENLDVAKAQNAQAGDVMSSASDLAARASELIVLAGNQAINDEDRASVVAELRTIADSLDDLKNTRTTNGSYLFSDGDPAGFAVGSSSLLTPVPSAADMFERSGTLASDDIRAMADSIAANDNAAIQAAVGTIDDIVTHFAEAGAQIGFTATRIDRIEEDLDARRLNVSVQLTDLSETNLSEAIALLNQQTITLQAAQAAFARINSRTLMDLL